MSANQTQNQQAEKPISDMGYEDAFSEFELVVKSLESGDLSLEESIALYERGQTLAKRCIELLDQAEIKISIITDDQIKPFNPLE